MFYILTNMNSRNDFLTAIQSDWTPENVSGLISTLNSAYRAVLDRTNPDQDPLYDTPNLPLVRGYLRWAFVDSHLARACEIGVIKGIEPIWVDLTDRGSGIMALELTGKHTSLMAHHLQNPDDPPRYSELRYDRRVQNWSNPMLPGFSADEPKNGLIHLTLIHGDKDAEFAFLRIYNNPDELKTYTPASGNIMENPAIDIAATETEQVDEPEIGLRENTDTKRKKAQNE
jgi:hypothetical protein